MSTTFKTCLFGGFDREDVISYIEKTAKENKERIQELTESAESLQHDNESLRQELEALRKSAAEALAVAEQYEALRVQADEVSQRAEMLENENKDLRVQADEYQSLKDHIAEIEISAHRRTQEFRAAAIARLHDTVAQQKDRFDRQRAQFAEIHEGIRGKLQAAQEALGALDLSDFDRINEDLADLDHRLDE